MSWKLRSLTLTFAAAIFAALPLSAQNSFAIVCPATIVPGSQVLCSINLTLASGVSVDSISYNVNETPSSGAPAATGIAFADGLGNFDGGGTSAHQAGANFYSVAWIGMSPAVAGPGTQLTGTFKFTVPSTAVAGQTYTVNWGSNPASASFMSNPVTTTESASQVISIPSVLTFSTPAAGALPGATSGAAYSQTFTATGGTTPYTWTVNSGSLPTGLSIGASTGIISGTPTATGAFNNITVTATDSATPTPATVNRTFTLAVGAAITGLTPATLPSGSVGSAYTSGAISVTGGSSPYTFSTTANLAGIGLALAAGPAATTTISGTPTAAATAMSIPIKVTDANGATFTGNVSLTINGPLSLSPATGTTLLTGTQGFVYTTGTGTNAIAAGGGTPPYHYTAGSAGVLPGGLTVNATSGAITGTPTAAGTFSNVQVTVTDSAGTPATVTNTYTIVINPTLTITAPATIPNGTATAVYPTTSGFSAAGGSGSYTWAVSGLPGVTATFTAPGTTATIGGTPTTPNAADAVTVTVTDANFPGVSVSKVYNIVIAAGVAITAPATGALTTGTIGRVYAGTGVNITTSGGTAAFTWSVSAGALPPGLALTGTGTGGATGLISGTPTGTVTTPVTSTFTVKVVDNAGSSATQAYTITVYAAPTLTGPATLPTAAVGSGYTTAPNPFTEAGGAPTIVWSATGLPTGLSINATTGVITGTPTTNTGSPYTVTITVTDGDGATASVTPTLVVNPVITLTPATLPVAIPGVAYSNTLKAGGGSGAGYTFTATGLPNNGGLTLSSAGVLSGTPSANANANSPYAVTVTVTDGNGSTHTFPYSLIIAPPLVITAPASVPAGLINAPYAGATVTVTGGTTPYTFTATGLPPGLTIGSSTGTISGTPTAVAGSPYSVKVTVTDKNGTTATTNAFSIAVSALPLQIITGLLPTGVVNAPYPFTPIQVQGGVGNYTWSITGLPPGLTTDGSGNISGTPTTTAGSPFTVVVKVTDASLNSVSRTYTLTISGVLTVVLPTTLPAATLNVAYVPVTAVAGGGLTPYTWAATGLPTGMSVNIATGVISGTPTTAAGTPYSVTLTVTDSRGVTASMTYTLAVNSPLTISGPASLPNGTLGAAYVSTTVTATGGSGVYTWTATGLPSGLSIAGATGAITGTPSGGTASVNTVVVTVTDSNSATATKTYTLTVNPGASSAPIITSVSASTEGQSLIAPNTWVSIYGSNFAPTAFTDTWTTSIKNSSTGALPIILDGVSVMVGGQAAYVAFLSATQINILTPNIGFGPLQVTVTNLAGTSNAVTITSQQDVTGLFEWPSGCTSNCQPVATHSNYTEAVANGTFAGVTTVPAAPGETIVLWGSGFGPTTPAIPYGVAVPTTPVFDTTANVSVTLNGAPVTVYQNLAFLTSGNAGLFQIGVTLPATLANGSYPLVVTINGIASPTLYLTVSN